MSTPSHDNETSTCTQCGEHPANHHLCQIIDGQKVLLDLCPECASAWNKSSATPFPDILNAKCYYCGGRALSGSMNQDWEKKARGQDFHYTCITCFKNYSRLYLKCLNGVQEDLPPNVIMEKMSEAIIKIDRKVREEAVRSIN